MAGKAVPGPPLPGGAAHLPRTLLAAPVAAERQHGRPIRAVGQAAAQNQRGDTNLPGGR